MTKVNTEARNPKSSLALVATDRVQPNPWNPNMMPEENYAELKESIRITEGEYLEHNAPLVRPIGNLLELVDGFHRWLACTELKRETLWVEIRELTDEQARILSVIRNQTRGHLNYFLLSKLLNEMYKGGDACTQDELARKFGFSRGWIVHLLNIYPRMKGCVHARKLENSLIVELARVKNAYLRDKLVAKAMDRNWKRNTVRTHATKFNALTDYVTSLNGAKKVKETLILKLEENILFNFDLNALKNEIDLLFQNERKRRIIHGDACKELQRLETVFDCVIADPPFALSTVSSGRKFTFKSRKAIDQKKGTWDEFTKKEFLTFTKTWIQKVYSVLKDGGALFIFAADAFLSFIIQILAETGFTHRATLTWHKTNPAPNIMRKTFTSSVEYILYAAKGKPQTFNWLGDNSMHNFIATPIPSKKYDHPTQKPVRVIEKLLKVATNVGDVVLDPFAGTGTTAVACTNLNRGWVLIEQEQKWIKVVEARTQ